jgi:hypothetical protein
MTLGQMTEYAKFNAAGYKTQDIFYGANSKPTQQYDFNLDKSYTRYDFSADGSQTATLFGVTGLLTEYAKFNASGYKTQDIFYGANGKPTQQYDFNLDKSYASHIFNSDGSQIAALFGTTGQMTQYTTYNASMYKTQDLFYGTNNKLIKQIDFNLDRSYTSHVFNADGSQVVALFGIDGQMKQYTSYNASLYKTQDIFYGADSKVTKQVDFNLDHSYTSHLYNADGSQIAALFNTAGVMTEYATFNANSFMTQDLLYSNSGVLTKQYNFNLDHSYTLYNFAANGSQTVSLYGTNGQMTEFATFNAKQFMTQDIFYGANGLKTKQFDINLDSSYASHVFNADGSQVAGAFGSDGKMTQYTFFNASSYKTQDIYFNALGNKTAQYDFNLDKSSSTHIFNPDGSQVAALYGANGVMTEYAAFNSNSKLTQDIFYASNGTKAKGFDFYSDNSYSAHVFSGNIEKVGSFGANGVINGYAEYFGSTLSLMGYFNAKGQEIEFDRYDYSGKLTGFNQFTYRDDGSYISRAYDATGHLVGQSSYSGDGFGSSQSVSYGGGAGIKIPYGGGNLYMFGQI